MKKIFTIIALVIFTMGAYAQVAEVKGDETTTAEMLTNDYFEFVFPAEIKEDKIEGAAKYYTEYFNVAYNSDNKVVKISFVENTDMARRVVTRFLLSSGIRTVDFNGQTYTIMEFYDAIMKLDE